MSKDNIHHSLDDYDIISNLGNNSAYYKVKKRATSEICVWVPVSYENCTESEITLLLKSFNERKSFKHPNVLQFYNYIKCDSTKTFYFITDCCKYGSLSNVIDKCLKEDKFLDEDFIWRALYQIACVLKLSKFTTEVCLENIFLDTNFTLKLYCFETRTNFSKNVNVQKYILNIAHVIYQLCTLQMGSSMWKSQLKITFYSNQLKNFIIHMLESSSEVTLDSILCHPTVLLKSSQNAEQNIFLKEIHTTCNLDEEKYRARLNNLKNREAAIHKLQEELSHKEHLLRKREKKTALMERFVKDKLVRAELYLKHSREKKSSTSSNGKSSCSQDKNYDNLNVSLSAAECDSVIVPTSTKMDFNIAKPKPFTRTMSERKIRFKGHSPLKDIRNIPRHSRDNDKYLKSHENKSHAEKLKLENLIKKSKQLFQKEANHICEVTAIEGNDCRPISWTEETKKHAFDLLRVMNAAESENHNSLQVKHTHL